MTDGRQIMSECIGALPDMTPQPEPEPEEAEQLDTLSQHQ